MRFTFVCMLFFFGLDSLRASEDDDYAGSPLKRACIDVKSTNELHQSILAHRYDSVKRLLTDDEKSARPWLINARTNTLDTALHLLFRNLACASDNEIERIKEITSLLLERGADIHCKNEERKSVLDIIMSYDRDNMVVDVIRLLIAYGAHYETFYGNYKAVIQDIFSYQNDQLAYAVLFKTINEISILLSLLHKKENLIKFNDQLEYAYSLALTRFSKSDLVTLLEYYEPRPFLAFARIRSLLRSPYLSDSRRVFYEEIVQTLQEKIEEAMDQARDLMQSPHTYFVLMPQELRLETWSFFLSPPLTSRFS